jgi:hypothetical protein
MLFDFIEGYTSARVLAPRYLEKRPPKGRPADRKITFP